MNRSTTAGIVHEPGYATMVTNISYNLLSFKSKTVQCDAYDTIMIIRHIILKN